MKLIRKIAGRRFYEVENLTAKMHDAIVDLAKGNTNVVAIISSSGRRVYAVERDSSKLFSAVHDLVTDTGSQTKHVLSYHHGIIYYDDDQVNYDDPPSVQ